MSEDKLEFSPLFRLRNHVANAIELDKKHFLGKVLTIVDASISDSEQRKGLKDLIQDAFYQGNSWGEEVREVLLQFTNKFCPDHSPKSKEDRNIFLGKVLVEESPRNDYFN